MYLIIGTSAVTAFVAGRTALSTLIVRRSIHRSALVVVVLTDLAALALLYAGLQTVNLQ